MPGEERHTRIPQANALLGYPNEARLLIINADDFGMCHSNNEATLRALTEGVATSTSLMAPCPWAPHAMRLLRERPDIPFGVHLTLICEFSDYRWGPITPADRVPSLVDASGHFVRDEQQAELLAQARREDVEHEFQAQIERVLGAGLRPSHLDFHCLADGGREDIFELTLELANEYGLAMRVHDRARAASLRRAGLPANDHGVLESYRLDPAEKQARYAQLLRDLPPGLNEWAGHPAVGTAESRVLEPDTWPVRRTDFDFLTSAEARQIIAEEQIVLLDYRALQRVWAT